MALTENEVRYQNAALADENTRMRGVLKDIWDDGMQGLSADMRNRIEHCLGISSEQEMSGGSK